MTKREMGADRERPTDRLTYVMTKREIGADRERDRQTDRQR